MKLICLNLQCGVNYKSLVRFIEENSSGADIFCFQEVFNNPEKIRDVLKNGRPNLFNELQNLLLDFNGYYASLEENDVGGLVIFIKKKFVVSKINNIVLFPVGAGTADRNNEYYFSMGRNLQYVEFGNSEKIYTVLNFHGMWTVKEKGDTEKRIEQSKLVRKIFDDANGAKILCGDLNILPNTRSLAILTKGNTDLVQKFGIISTRSISKGRQEVVDYVITSPEIRVIDFAVPTAEVSDHLPLILEFE